MASKTNDVADFTDIENHWAKEYILIGKSLELIKGYDDGTFKPDEYITRSEIVALVVRIKGLESGSTQIYDFTDLEKSYWAYESIQKAVNLGLIKGYPDSRFGVYDNAKRAEAMVIIYRLLGLLDKEDDFKESEIPGGVSQEDKNSKQPVSESSGSQGGSTTTPSTETNDKDNDGLSDSDEEILGTDPNKADTDGNGINDGDEDFDNDGLTNAEEIRLGTIPYIEDSDGDGLIDSKEIELGTNPLKADTDGDGLSDGDEVILGLNPLVVDTDGNGIPDGEEKIQQSLSVDINESEKPEVTRVTISMAGTGNIQRNTSIESVYGIDMLSSNVVGLIGVPVEIESDSEFDQATITFSYDENLLGETKEEDLAVMWYDEENNMYQIFDTESVVDTLNNTVSYTTTHFSTYLVVDRQKWYDVWSDTITYQRDKNLPIPIQYFDISYVVDCSGSMSGSNLSIAKEAVGYFINAMYDQDRASIISFESTARLVCKFTNSKIILTKALDTLSASGGTSVEAGLIKSIELFESNPSTNSKMIILLCDGDVNATSATIQRAKDNGIRIYPVLIGYYNSISSLETMAKETCGKFYYAATAEEIREAIIEIQKKTVGEIDTTDKDSDGLYDIFETAGMILPNGQYVYTDPQKRDTDGDGLSDGYEMGAIEKYDDQPKVKQMVLKKAGFNAEIYAQYFDYRSDPTTKDSDNDGYEDKVDPWPLNDDVDVIELINGDYGSYVPVIKDGITSYGGDQSWFSKDNFMDPDYFIRRFGCGHIAMSDLFLYWAIKDSTYETNVTDIAMDANKELLAEKYMTYVRVTNLLYSEIIFGAGVLGPNVASGINDYCRQFDFEYRAKWKLSLSDKEMYLMIKEMLLEDIPVILSIGPNTPDLWNEEVVKLYKILKNGENGYDNTLTNQLYQFEAINSTTGHYVTVTGIIIDDIADITMLRVSSWGNEYYINYDEYRDYVDNTGDTMTSSIVYISR